MTSVAATFARLSGDDVRARARRGWACGVAAAIIWGGYLAVSHQGIAAGLDAADLAFLRYTIAGLLMLPWLARRNPHRLAGIGWRKGAVLALLAGPLFVLAGASGYRFAPLAHGAVIQLGVLTLTASLLAAALVGERPGAGRMAGLAIVIVGLAITAGPSMLQGGSTVWIGDILFATAGFMWALFTVLQRRWSVAPLTATAVVSVLSGAIFAPFYLARHGLAALGAVSPLLIAEQVLVQGVLSGVVALFAFSAAVQALGPARAALFPVLAPAVAILIGVLLSGERPNGFQIAGLLVLSAGLLIAARRASPAPNPPTRNSKGTFHDSA